MWAKGQHLPEAPFKLRRDVGTRRVPRMKEQCGMGKGPVAGEGLKGGLGKAGACTPGWVGGAWKSWREVAELWN